MAHGLPGSPGLAVLLFAPLRCVRPMGWMGGRLAVLGGKPARRRRSRGDRDMNRPARLALLAAAGIGLVTAPLVLGSFAVTLLNYIGISALVALGLVLLTGIGGMTSFGQAAFVGIAAYATAWATVTMGLSPWIGLLLALVLTGLAGLAIGALTLRLDGHFLSLSTIAWGISIYFLFGTIAGRGRNTGMAGLPPITPLTVQL